MNTNFPIHRNNFEQIRDERRTAANTAFRIGNAFLSLLGLIEDSNSDIEEQFLHSQVEDVAEEKITFRKGLQVGNRFTSGLLGEGGIFRKEADGTTYLEADKLYIRIKALFDNVEIRDFKHSAGNRIASPAGMKCCRVEWLDANGDVVQQADANLPQVVRFRCYFRGSDGEDEVRNNFIVGDQAYCHITSVDTKADDPNSKGLNMKHYWRLVVGRNPSGSLTDDGEHWIDLSNQATETLTIDGHTYTHAGYQDGSDIPVAQDDIIQLGNIYDTDRMGAIIEFVTGADAPSYQIFQDINGFDLSGKNYLSLGYSTQTGHAYLNVYGDAYIGDPEGSTYIRYEQGDGTPQHRPSLRIKAHVEFLNSDQELDDLVQNHQRDDSYDDRAIRAMIAGLQDQIDGAIDTWFFNGTPGASVLPESDWKSKDEQSTPISYNERLKHLGDLYYDNQTGYAYRYVNSGSEQSPVFSWSPISDSAVVEALAAAARAQDTADHKRRIFLSTPYPPYDAGDMWVNAVWPASGTSQGSVYNDDILKCINPVPRTGVSAFSIDDWTKASKYTDDSKFNGYINALLNGSGASGDSATAAAVQRAIISAMGGSTVVSGGLMLTSMLALRKLNAGGDPTDLNDYTTWAGINGVYDDTKTTGGIAAWYGGGMKDYETLSAAEKAHGWNTERWAKSLHRFDGSGYVAGGNISWNSAGAVTIQGTTINATNLQKGGSSVLSQAEGDARYITVSFFETLFNAMNSSGQKVSANTTTGIASIKAMFGFWTQQYISALGQGTDGGGGGQGDVTWQLLADPDIRQINLTHLTTALGTLTGYTTSGKNYAVQKDSSNHLYVNVPWTDTVYTLPTASSSTKGGVKVGTTLAISSAVLNLKSDIVTAGTYTKVTVDTYGRVTAGYTLSASDIPDLRWDKITSGTPTTLSGYGITDAKIASGVITLGSNTITPVTSVAMSVPTGFSVSGSPVTKTGTLALTYASGYEGFTTTLKNRINTLWAMFTREGSGTAADPYVIKANYGLYTDSFLSALGQGSDSGGGQGDVTWALLASTATGGRTIDISYITNALTNGGYATQSWVHQQGYTTNIGTVTQVKVGSTAYNPSSGVVSLPAYPSDYWSTQTSRTKNTVLAAPNDSAGAASFRALVAADIPNLAASKITSGTFSTDRIPDLSSTYATSARATTLEGYFTNGIAKNANKLDNNTSDWYMKRGVAYTSSNTGTYWQKVATCSIEGSGTHDTSLTLIVSEHYSRNGSGILVLNGRKNSGASAVNTDYTKAYWVCRDNIVKPDEFVLTAKIESSTKTTFNLYKKQVSSYKVSRFAMLDEGKWYDKSNLWTLLTATGANENSYSSIPSDETQFVSVDYSAASQLVTSRSLWGQSFDGTADISGNISNAGNITPSATASKNLGSDTLMFEYGYIRRINTQSGYNLRLGAAGVEYIQINASSGAVSISSAVSMSSTLGVTGATTLTGLLTANGGVVVPSSKTIKIGNAYLSYDSTNNAIRVSANADGTGAANFYAMGAVSALGQGSDSGGGGGQGDVTWQLLADNNDTRQIALSHITTALSTLTGYTTSGKNYKVQKDSSNHLYVAVPWTNTTYTFATGDSNGQIKVTPSGGTAQNVSVKGLGSLAYKSSLTASDIPSLSYLPLSGGTVTSFIYLRSALTTSDTVNTGAAIGIMPKLGNPAEGDTTSTKAGIGFIYYRPNVSSNDTLNGISISAGGSTHWYDIAGGLYITSSEITWQNNKVWHAGNDGSDSGLDADKLDGLHADSFYHLSGGIDLNPSSTNLVDIDSLNTIGDYYCSAKNNVQYVSTLPAGITNAFRLRIGNFFAGGNRYIYQRVQQYSSTAVYERYSSASTLSYSSWYQVQGNWTRIDTLEGYFTNGSANTAVALKTARSIWGQSFDGTASITGNLTLNNNTYIYSKDSDGTGKLVLGLNAKNNLLLGYETAGAGYNTIIYGNNIYFSYGTSRTTGLFLSSSGDVGIGTTTPSTKLEVSGATTTGTLAISSTSAVAHLSFERGGYNYIRAAATSGNIAFVTNGKAAGSSANVDMLVSDGAVSVKGTLSVSGATTLSSTLAVTGATTLTGLLTANGNIQTGSSNGAYVQIGAVRLVYDSTNNAIKVVQSDGSTAANFYATGAVSALGQGSDSGSGGGQGDVTWTLLASTATGGRTIDSSYISGTLSNYLPRSGGQMTGNLTWKNSTALPERSSVAYILSIDSFTDGGKTYWSSLATLKTSLGLGSLAYKSSLAVSDIPNLSGNYLSLSGGTITGRFGALKIKRDTNDSSAIKFLGSTDTTLGFIGVNPDKQPIFTQDANTIYKIWHAGNDGASSGLDADLLDGQHGSYYATASSVSTLQGYFTSGVAKQAACLKHIFIAAGDDYDTISGYTASRGSFVAVNYSDLTTTDVTLDDLGKYDTLVSFGYGNRTIQFKGSAYSGNTLKYRSLYNDNGNYIFSDWSTIAFTTSNVASATKLQTSRSLWGQSFNGTADISGNISNTGNITPSATASKNLGSSTLMFEYGYIRRINTQSGYDLRIGAGGTQYIQIGASSGAVSVSSAVSMSSTLGVTGATTLRSTLSVSGNTTISGTLSLKSDAYSGDYCINCNNSDIVGVNSIYTADLSDNYTEGILFKRTNGNYDSFRAADGKFYFGINNGASERIWIEPTAGSADMGLVLNGTQYRMEFMIGSGNVNRGIYGRTSGKWLLYFDASNTYCNYGNFISNLGVTALSDARHKRVISDTNISVEQIAKMPSVLFKWTDGKHDDKIYAGTLAQEWQNTLPQAIVRQDNEEGTLAFNYGVAALVASITTARKVVDHEKRIQELERENKRLKEMLNVA